ncbi:MAG: efflux RND transporter periplasmic adaptor subunit [Desulfobulbaceae bacterium]|nr:efflux RND transporter periplasmic adaptor subunit [Desulfobulbaceae bacterium]
MKKIRYTAVLLTLLAAYPLTSSHVRAEDAQHQEIGTSPVAVTSSPIIKRRVLAATEAAGTVEAVDRAVIASKVLGTIEEIPVILGSKVTKGDLLVKIGAGEISARVLQAQAQMDQTKRNLDREKNLLAKQAATSESVKSLEDMYKVASAAYQEAKIMFSYTKITAPFDGLVTAKPGNVGDLATPGTPLVQVENIQKLQVVASIPEKLALDIKPGDTLPLQIPAADLDTEGTVAEIAPVADPMSRTTAVKINVPESERLRPGQFARIILMGQDSQGLFIPASAVQQHGQIKKCFVIIDGKAALRIIRTGKLHKGEYEVLSGLREGELVITEVSHEIVEGQTVTQ